MILNDLLRRSGVEFCEELRKVLNKVVQPNYDSGPWVAGGCIRRLIMGTDPLASDIDVFFASEQQKNEWLTRITQDYTVVSKRQNAHNVTLKILFEEREIELQAIHVQYYESAEAVIDSFDYTICQFITDGSKLKMGEFSLWDLARKRLVLHELTYPVATMRRMIKYSKQGFFSCGGMMTELLDRVTKNPELINDKFVYID